MNRNMKNLLDKTIENEAQVENIIEKIIPDNLDFGCKLIKQAVIDSAEEALRKDLKMNEGIELRKKSKEKGEQFTDEIFLREISAILPEQLRPKIGGLTQE